MFYSLWPEHISIYDNFLDAQLLKDAQDECTRQIDNQGAAFDIYNLIHQDTETSPFFFQPSIHALIDAAVREHCANAKIDYENLYIKNRQLGFLRKYDEEISKDAFHDAHHDLVENAFINPILYLASDYGKQDKWVGGELVIYKDLTNAQFPSNQVRIKPLENRLIIFSAYNVHRVLPYFGETPRTALITCYALKDLKKYDNIIL